MRALTILKRAAALMDAGRWMKGNFHAPERKINIRTGRRMTTGKVFECYCAAGAISAIAGDEQEQRWKAFGFLNRAIDPSFNTRDFPCDEEAVWDWNDNKKRTVGQVRRAFHKAIRIAEKEAA